MMLTYPTTVPQYTVKNRKTQVIKDWRLKEDVAVEALPSTHTSHLKAAQLFQKAISTGTISGNQPGLEAIFLADLYRRAGDFATARQILNQSQTQSLEASLVKVLEYEQDLIQAQDIGYYQIAEALEV